MPIPVPIFPLQKIIDSLIEYVRVDLTNAIQAGNEENAWLHQLLFGTISGDNFDLYKTAKSIFSRTIKDKHKITTTLEFPKDIRDQPMIIFREPSSSKGEYNTIGDDVGSSFGTGEAQTKRGALRISKKAMYELVCVSPSHLEVMAMSVVIESLLEAAYETLLETMQLDLFSLGSEEIIMNSELNPYPILMRSIKLDAQYQSTIPSIDTETFTNIIKFNKPTFYG